MGDKIKVGILFGGRSVEHSISLRSAENINQFIDRDKFETILIGIDLNGNWFLMDEVSKLIEQGQSLNFLLSASNPSIINRKTGQQIKIDIGFPVLHGTNGEDGSIQGFLKTFDIPCVGTGVLGSSISMNKRVSKKLLENEGIPVAKYECYSSNQKSGIHYPRVVDALGSPFIIKPESLGSSVGVSKVKSESEFTEAIEECFRFDNGMIIEEFIVGRELECSILGNNPPKATSPGEIKVNEAYDFYTFDAKYVDPEAAQLSIPANVDEEIQNLAKDLSLKSFKILCCEDYARVDLFLRENGDVVINEINTIPGFTNSSMFPKLWENEGTPYSKLISSIIMLAMERFQDQNAVIKKFESSLD
jgi:D-alanine-D-alanine ligase